MAWFRVKHVRPLVSGRVVLDFGCGANAWAARSLKPLCKRIDGLEPTLSTGIVHGIKIVSVLEQLQENDNEVVIALAVFEHLHPHVLRQVLQQLYAITTPDAVIAGTVPTPLGRPILAFLSYRLGLIDPSQIRDHKVYYDDLWLGELLRGSHWCLRQYNTF